MPGGQCVALPCRAPPRSVQTQLHCRRMCCRPGLQVFFDIEIGGSPAGRIVMGLYGGAPTHSSPAAGQPARGMPLPACCPQLPERALLMRAGGLLCACCGASMQPLLASCLLTCRRGAQDRGELPVGAGVALCRAHRRTYRLRAGAGICMAAWAAEAMHVAHEMMIISLPAARCALARWALVSQGSGLANREAGGTGGRHGR